MLRTWACLAVGEVAVDDVHHAAEHGGADGLALGLVGRARPHLVEGPRWSRTSKRPMARAGASAQAATSAMPSTASRPMRSLEVLQETARVAVEEDRRLAGRTDARRLHLGLVDGAGVEPEVVEDLARDRELDRPGQLEAVATGELGSGRHAADEVVLLEAEDPHAAARHHHGSGESVVPGPDDDGVVVGHLHHRSDPGAVRRRP